MCVCVSVCVHPSPPVVQESLFKTISAAFHLPWRQASCGFIMGLRLSECVICRMGWTVYRDVHRVQNQHALILSACAIHYGLSVTSHRVRDAHYHIVFLCPLWWRLRTLDSVPMTMTLVFTPNVMAANPATANVDKVNWIVRQLFCRVYELNYIHKYNSNRTAHFVLRKQCFLL